jgi:hypothetical protein
MRGQRPTSEVSVMVVILAILAVSLISFCAYRWKRQYAGLGRGRTTFLVSLAIVIAYNVILVVWFWRTIPQRFPLKSRQACLSGSRPFAPKCRGFQLFEKLPFNFRLVSGAHELYDDTLCPRCTILCRVRATQSFTHTLADGVQI